jgi:hypothetical protein
MGVLDEPEFAGAVGERVGAERERRDDEVAGRRPRLYSEIV